MLAVLQVTRTARRHRQRAGCVARVLRPTLRAAAVTVIVPGLTPVLAVMTTARRRLRWVGCVARILQGPGDRTNRQNPTVVAVTAVVAPGRPETIRHRMRYSRKGTSSPFNLG